MARSPDTEGAGFAQEWAAGWVQRAVDPAVPATTTTATAAVDSAAQAKRLDARLQLMDAGVGDPMC